MAALETNDQRLQGVASSSTVTSTNDVKQSNTSSLTSVNTDGRATTQLNKKGNMSTIRVRVVESHPKPLLQAADTETHFCNNKRIEKMLAEPTLSQNMSVTSEVETEFDWKDYNFKNDQSTMDPRLLDSNSDMETWGPPTWERKYAYRDDEKVRDVYFFYPRDNASQSSLNSLQSSSQIIKPEQIRGILKAKKESVAQNAECLNKNVNYSDPPITEAKDPYDIEESIEIFNQYLQERIVRFERNRSKKTKLRFLSRNLTVQKRAEWDKSSGKRKRKKKYEEGDTKLPPLQMKTVYKTIQDFEKRNFTHTASKMGDVENLFLKNKLTPSECCSSSDEDNDEDLSQDNVEIKRLSVPSPKENSRRQRVKRAMSLRGDENLLPLRGANQFIKAVNKVQRMMSRKRFKLPPENVAVDGDDEERVTPLERFRHAGRLVVIMLRAVGIKPVKSEDSDYNFLSWTIVYDELGISRLSYDSTGLTFDPQLFKANKESFLSTEIRDILLTSPPSRTDAQIQAVIRFLSQVVPAFGEYPLRIQRSTLKCCTYERFEPGRVIIRQGHRAENFYFILSGTAVVTIMESGLNHVHTVNLLSSGNSFGELAFLNMSQRTATVTCRETVELLCIERDDFVKIFMRRVKDKEPEHVTFLKNVDVLKGWPLEKLPLDNLKICAFTYVRRGVTLCPDSSRSDWLFVVVSGTCKILKALNDVNPSSENITSNQKTHGVSSRHSSRFPRVIVSEGKTVTDSTADRRQLHRKSKGGRCGNLNNRLSSGIANVINRSEQEVIQSRSEHTSQLDSIYQKLHVLPSINQRQRRKHHHAGHSRDDSSTHLKKDTYLNQELREANHRRREEDEEEQEERSAEADDEISLSTDGTLSSLSPVVTPLPQTPEVHVAAATPSQFLRPATQNFGIHRPSLKPTEDALAPIAAVQKAWKAKKRLKPKVFIEVARLEPGDVFGLEHVVMGEMDDVTSTSLVSDGAEVVIIEKKFFRKHLTEETAKRIRQTIRPLPSDSVLQQNLVNQRHWDAYKSKTLETQARHLVQTKLNHAFRA